jgi:hypothetical protein
MPPITIELPGGEKFNPASVAPTSDEPTVPRTRLDIARELDTREREVTAALVHVAELEADVKRLEKELRGYGLRKRTPKATP